MTNKTLLNSSRTKGTSFSAWTNLYPVLQKATKELGLVDQSIFHWDCSGSIWLSKQTCSQIIHADWCYDMENHIKMLAVLKIIFWAAHAFYNAYTYIHTYMCIIRLSILRFLTLEWLAHGLCGHTFFSLHIMYFYLYMYICTCDMMFNYGLYVRRLLVVYITILHFSFWKWTTFCVLSCLGLFID